MPGDLVACIGAGGKTTTCWRTWDELRCARQPAILTTTTHMFEPIMQPASALVLSRHPDASTVLDLLARHSGVALAASRLSEAAAEFEPNDWAPSRSTRLQGLGARVIDALAATMGGVTWLVEADGARGRLLKAPAAHEPVIPSSANVVVVLAHTDAIGLPLDEATVHRPERVAELLGLPLGQTLRAEHIAQLVCHPAGGLKGVPAQARVIAVLNQRDASRPHPQFADMAQATLASGRYERVVSASLRAESPILGVRTR